MKKLLLATSALLLTAGVAAADYKIGGTARVGLVYNDPVSPSISKTQVNMRLRFNFDASKETDSGVTFGGRIRMQYDAGRINDNDDIAGNRSGATLNAAYVYASFSGFRVEVGNANTAFDSLGTLYNSELGYVGTTQGSYNLATYTSYQTSPYGRTQINRMGLFVSYAVGDLSVKASYINPDQTVKDLPTGTEAEFSLAVDYKIGAIKLGAGYVNNGNFLKNNSSYALLGEYAVNDKTNVGLQIIGNDPGGAAKSVTGVTLYGNTMINQIGVGAFISTTDSNAVKNKTAYGIGASYDLGGATLAGTIQKGFADNTYADLGVKFSF